MCPEGVLEVVTRLGDSVVDVMVVPRARLAEAIVRAGFDVPDELPVPLIVRSGLGTLVATDVGRRRRFLPRGQLAWGVIACVAMSLAAHLGVYLAAVLQPAPHGEAGASRPRLVANRATAARGQKAEQAVPSVTAEQSAPRSAQAVAETTRGHGTPQPPVAQGTEMTRAQIAAQTPDPDPDGGIIPSGPYETNGSSGRGYSLHERERRELALSVVKCSGDGDCSTVSGVDQDDIRKEIARHVGDLNGCLRHGAASVELTIDDGGEVHVHAKDGGEPADCIASVIARLQLHGGRGDVTLAFTAGD